MHFPKLATTMPASHKLLQQAQELGFVFLTLGGLGHYNSRVTICFIRHSPQRFYCMLPLKSRPQLVKWENPHGRDVQMWPPISQHLPWTVRFLIRIPPDGFSPKPSNHCFRLYNSNCRYPDTDTNQPHPQYPNC